MPISPIPNYYSHQTDLPPARRAMTRPETPLASEISSDDGPSENQEHNAVNNKDDSPAAPKRLSEKEYRASMIRAERLIRENSAPLSTKVPKRLGIDEFLSRYRREKGSGTGSTGLVPAVAQTAPSTADGDENSVCVIANSRPEKAHPASDLLNTAISDPPDVKNSLSGKGPPKALRFKQTEKISVDISDSDGHSSVVFLPPAVQRGSPAKYVVQPPLPKSGRKQRTGIDELNRQLDELCKKALVEKRQALIDRIRTLKDSQGDQPNVAAPDLDVMHCTDSNSVSDPEDKSESDNFEQNQNPIPDAITRQDVPPPVDHGDIIGLLSGAFPSLANNEPPQTENRDNLESESGPASDSDKSSDSELDGEAMRRTVQYFQAGKQISNSEFVDVEASESDNDDDFRFKTSSSGPAPVRLTEQQMLQELVSSRFIDDRHVDVDVEHLQQAAIENETRMHLEETNEMFERLEENKRRRRERDEYREMMMKYSKLNDNEQDVRNASSESELEDRFIDFTELANLPVDADMERDRKVQLSSPAGPGEHTTSLKSSARADPQTKDLGHEPCTQDWHADPELGESDCLLESETHNPSQTTRRKTSGKPGMPQFGLGASVGTSAGGMAHSKSEFVRQKLRALDAIPTVAQSTGDGKGFSFRKK